MSEEPFSLAAAEAKFGPEAWARMGEIVAAAPPFTPEQREKYRALFATALNKQPATPGSEGGGLRC
ncbi:hypothetical protein [Streptomyces sp. NPDC047024]|uniref:hypothetical protein n=1 Tax=Streptomyces sp. NPDC047024 TaxID=3155476 RepID=UPI0033F2481A